MDWDDVKFVWLFAFVVYFVVMLSIEFPVIGIILLGSVIVFFIWLFYVLVIDKEQEKKEKIIRESETQELTYEEELQEELTEELEAILKKEIKVISTAYRKSVTSNSFGKKNYDKFIPELLEFLEDNSNTLKELEDYHDSVVGLSMGEESINLLISRIEEDIEKLNSDSEYSEDMD